MKLPEKAVHGIYKDNADVIVRMQRHRLVTVVRAQSSDQAYRMACAASDAVFGSSRLRYGARCAGVIEGWRCG
jgi:hypothetical protein